QAIERDNFVVLEGTSLDHMLAPLYFGRSIAQRDWDCFLNVFGVPSTFIVGPPNVPSTKEAEYVAIANQLIADGRGYLPNGADLKYVNGGGGKPPFKERLDYIDKQIILVGTGGLLTMLAETGSGTLAGGAHAETFRQVARGDAAAISEVFQKDVDMPVLD
ncbi:MAG: hypothetical protein PHR35_18130, partial [Kiritimatiellae bacterium]|nr:hypothetical protein [Kiritimatiellia bacterium]